ncbi:MAG: ArsC family transcriptional regulator, partial [Candidatus Rokuibacteriota bacterium]
MTLNVQIFGFKDCQDTRKALRFFAERRISPHFVDLEERPATRGEL